MFFALHKYFIRNDTKWNILVFGANIQKKRKHADSGAKTQEKISFSTTIEFSSRQLFFRAKRFYYSALLALIIFSIC